MSGKKEEVLGGVLGCSSLERHEDRVERLEIEQEELNPVIEPCRLGAHCLMLDGNRRRMHKAPTLLLRKSSLSALTSR